MLETSIYVYVPLGHVLLEKPFSDGESGATEGFKDESSRANLLC